MADIGYFSLHNKGAFVTKLAFEYYNASTNKWIRTVNVGEITVGNSKKASPGDYGVPDGSQVRVYAFVVAGSDKTGSEQFTFRKNNGSTAKYTISGTTLINSLKYDGTETLVVPDSKAEIGYFALQNNGGFVAHLEFKYFNKSTNQWNRIGGNGDITLGTSKIASPGNYGVPDGSLVKLIVNVAAGFDEESAEAFTYKKGSDYSAVYYISGITTDKNKLKFDKVLATTGRVYYTIQLKTKNSYFVCAENGGGRELVANRSAALEWETFTLATTALELRDGIKVGLISYNGKYVTAVNGGGTRSVIATMATQGAFETFTLRKVKSVNTPAIGETIKSGDKVAFCCASGSHYLAANSGGGDGSICTCEPPWMDVDEMFTINIVTAQGSDTTRVKTLFVPNLHGFHFGNNFTNVLIDYGSIRWTTQGRCGGMAFAALDYFKNDMPVPAYKGTLSVNTPLADYIYNRLIDSFISNGMKFIEWTIMKGDYKGVLGEGVPQLTRTEEFPKLMNALKNGPVALGLVKAKNLTDIGSGNHQVVAYGADLDNNNGKMTVYLYDNNYPDKTVTLTAFPTDQYFTLVRPDKFEAWRGFFVESYIQKKPPAGM